MQRIFHLLLALLLAGAGLAGCLGEPEESQDDGAQDGDETDRSRTIIADLPEGTTEVEINVSAWELDSENDTRVLVVVENATREVLTQETFDVEDETTRLLRVDPEGDERIHVTVRVIEGAADLEVEVRAVTADGEPTVVVHERVEYRDMSTDDTDDADGSDGANGDGTNGADDANGGDGADDGTNGADGTNGDANGDDTNDTVDDGANDTDDASGNETTDNETQP